MEELISAQAIDEHDHGSKSEFVVYRPAENLSHERNRQQLASPLPISGSDNKAPKKAVLVSMEGESMGRYTNTSSNLQLIGSNAMQVNQISVIILGTVGSGKRTLGKHMAQGGTSGTKTVFDSATMPVTVAVRQASMFYDEFTKDDTIYKILTIDTESMSHDYTNTILHIKKQFEDVNLIIFVISKGLHTNESHRSLSRAMENIRDVALQFSGISDRYRLPGLAVPIALQAELPTGGKILSGERL